MSTARSIQSCIAFLLILLGLTVIAGWYLESPVLVQIHENFTPMQYNTALGFLFIGFHILTNIRGYRRVSILFASVVALLGALTLFEYAFNVNLWIDTLFVTPSIGVPNEIPGRIGANTAFCFFAVGMLLVLDALRVLKFRVIGIGTGLVGALAAVSLWGYLIGIPELTGWGGLLSGMAVHTSAAMILVSLSLYGLYYEEVRTLEKTSLVFTPWMVAIPIVAITLCIWQAMVRLDDYKFREFSTERIEVMSKHLEHEYTERHQTIERLRDRWNQSSGNRFEDLENDSARYTTDIPGLKQIIIADKIGSRIAEYPELLDLGFDPLLRVQQGSSVELIEYDRQLHYTNGDHGFIMLPMKLQGAEQGVAVDAEILLAVFETQGLLADIMKPFTTQYHITVCTTDGQLYGSIDSIACEAASDPRYQLERVVRIADQDWVIRIAPTKLLIDSHASAWPAAILFIGVLVAFGIVQLVYLLRISNEARTHQQETLVQLQAQKELLEKANNNLLHSNAQMEEFAYTVSHDLKAPLVSIQGFSSFLKVDTDEQRYDRVSKFVGLIMKAAQGMDSTISNLLELSKNRNGAMKLERVDTQSVLNDLIEQLGPQLLQEDVKIIIENELLDTHADRIRVIQVFQNLITNAVKYGRPLEGQHEIRIKSDEVDGMVRFSVSDNGPGIDPDSQEQIFGVFKRLQTDGEGAGIGLSIVNRAVCQHGGRAWVESVPGNGATFFFTLPRYNIDSESRYPVEERKTTVA